MRHDHEHDTPAVFNGPCPSTCTRRMLASEPRTPAVLPVMRAYNFHAAMPQCACRVRQTELSLRGNQPSSPDLQVEGGQHRAISVQQGPVVERIPRQLLGKAGMPPGVVVRVPEALCEGGNPHLASAGCQA